MASGKVPSVHEQCSLVSTLGAGSRAEATACDRASCRGVLDLMLENLHEPVFLQDQAGTLLHANQPFADLFRQTPQALVGKTLDQLLTEQPLEIQVLSDEFSPGACDGRRCEVVISHAPGELRELVIVTTPLDTGGHGASVALGSVSDVTEARHSQRLVEQLTYIDTLTGLANLRRFEERLAQAVAMPEIAERGLGVMWLALDKLDLVRDSHGEAAAELMIRGTAEYLAGTIRERDLIAHVGHGRFAVILFTREEQQELAVAVDRIIRMVSRPVQIGGQEVHNSVRAGIALFPQDGLTPLELIHAAQTALNQASRKDVSHYRFYAPEMNRLAMERLELEARLRGALLRKELLLHYQPQICLESGRVVALEALLRWHSPEYGWVEPLRFIPLAESSGIIQPIGNWVLKTALAQMRRWLDAGMAPVRMAINVSASQLLHPGFIDMVGRSLQENALDPELLELELTESTLMHHSEQALKIFRALKKMGVHLAIDDFGTGYSSLAYLKSFPVDRLKIDRSFLKGLAHDSRDIAIIEAVINMAHGLGLEIVAEGVEEEHQYTFLMGSRCDIGQGFLWSRPQPAESFPACVDRFHYRFSPLRGSAQNM